MKICDMTIMKKMYAQSVLIIVPSKIHKKKQFKPKITVNLMLPFPTYNDNVY